MLEGITPPIKTPEVPKVEIELPPEKIAQLLFYSFKFSQGRVQLQKYIYHWLKKAFPEHYFNMAQMDEVKNLLKEMLTKYFEKNAKASYHVAEMKGSNILKHPHIIEEQANNETENYFKINNSSEVNEDALEDLVTSLVEREHDLLVKERGRPVPKNKYLSQIVKYAIEGKTTGIPEYDQMFQGIAQYLNDLESNEDDNMDLYTDESREEKTLRQFREIKFAHSQG